jgi:TM2 domain-containing membrane protein YozV
MESGRSGKIPGMDPYALQIQSTMTDPQRVAFQGEYFARRKDPAVGFLLAFFLGSFGAHRFYLGENGLAIVYLIFFWTGIPGLIAFVEAFFMPGRVRRWNDQMAMEVANRVRLVAAPTGTTAPPPAGSVFCTHCGQPMPAGAQFCAVCGKAAPAPLRA